MAEAAKDGVKGTPKGYAKSAGELGKIAGDLISTPLYKPYKQAYDLVHLAATGKPIKYEYINPNTILSGAMMGGMWQELINDMGYGWAKDHGYESWIYKSNKQDYFDKNPEMVERELEEMQQKLDNQ